MNWSPRLPSIFSATNIYGDNGIFSLISDEGKESLSNYAPKWLKPPVGAEFSFGNNIAVFSEKNENVIKEYKIH